MAEVDMADCLRRTDSYDSRKKMFTHSDDLKGRSEVSCIATEECLSESTTIKTTLREANAALSEANAALSEANAMLTAELNAAYSLARLAFTFRQITCSYVLNRPLRHVRYMTLDLLEHYVHDNDLYKSTLASDRWKKMCHFLNWNENWDTDDEIPRVVQYIDDKASDAAVPLVYSIDLDDVRKCLKETRDQLKQLPLDNPNMLLDKLNQIMYPLEQLKVLPSDECPGILLDKFKQIMD